MLSSETEAALSAALHNDADKGHGAYNSFDEWSVTLRGSAGSVGSRLVTAHEAMHAALNDVTSYGILLAACAVLSRKKGDRPGDSQTGTKLVRLVGSCRATHEAFATFESLWTVADADTRLLSGYSQYEGWFKDASELVPGPDSSQRKELMVQAALLACMQPPVLERLVADASWSSSAWWPLRMERPDERLSLLHGLSNDRFWSTAWAKCREFVPDAVQVDEWDRMSTPRRREWDLPGGLPTACVQVLYGEVAALLRRNNAQTLDYDGHRRLGAEVVAAAVRAGAPVGAVVPSRDDQDLQDEVFETWQRERLVIRDVARQAVLRNFSDMLRSGRMDVVSETGVAQHIFASVRPAGRLLAQFRFDDADTELLHDAGWEPVTTLRTTDPTGIVELTVVDPQQMADLGRALPREMPAYCNVSLAFLGDDLWLQRWGNSLNRWKISGLFDLSPSAQFQMWRNDRERITFAPTTMRGSDRDIGSLIVLRAGKSPVPLLIACTIVAGQAIEQYLSAQMSKARRDMSLVEKNPNLSVTVSHLLTEEYFLDFAAYPPT